jgi:hypothetical protein
VYGLFNFDYQLFIGEAANIQQALLHHQSDIDAQPAHLRPTGFTFEPCSAELRKRKTDELIAVFRPVLQTHARLRNGGRKTNVTTLRPVGVRRVTESLVHQQEFPLVEQTHIGARRRSRLSLRHAAVAAVFVPAAVAILYFGAPPSSSAQKELDPVSTMAKQNMVGAGSRTAGQRCRRPHGPAVDSERPRQLCGSGRGEGTNLLSRARRPL